MKKLVLVLIVSVLCVAVVCGININLKSTKSINPLSIVPKTSLGVIELNNLDKEVAFWKTSKLYNEISKLDIVAIATEMDASEKEIIELKENITKLKDVFNPINTELANQIFGKKIVIALLDINATSNNPDDIKKLLDNIVIIGVPKINTMLLSVIDKQIINDKTTFEKFENCNIKTILLDEDENISLSYTFYKGLAIASFSSQTIKNSILNEKNKEFQSILENEKFVTMKKELDTANTCFAFLDVNNAYKKTIISVENVLGENLKNNLQYTLQKKQLDASYGNMDVIAFSEVRTESEIVDKIIMTVKTDKESVFSSMLKLKPLELSDLKILSKENLLSMISSVSFPALIDYISNISPMPIDNIKPMFKESTQVEFDDFINALGFNYGVCLEDINTEGMYPLPKFSIFIALQDEEVIKTLLNNLLKQAPVKLENEEYETANIAYSNQVPPMIGNIKPGYTFFDNKLIISTDISTIKNMINAKKTDNNITSNKFFQDTASAVGIIEFEKTISKSQEVIKMLMRLNPNNKKASVMVNKIVLPVLEGLKMFKSIKVKSKINKNKVFSEYRTKYVNGI